MEEIKIKIKSIQKNPREEEKVELTFDGKYYKKNEKHYYIYEEITETGEKGTKNLITVKNNQIQITKFGVQDTVMTYIPGETTYTEYVTPYGNLQMEISTQKVEINLGKNGKGRLNFHYKLDLMGEELNNIVDIFIE